MRRIRAFVTGDMHGEYGRAIDVVRFLNQYIEDEVYLIAAGDFGYLFLDDFNEKKLLDDFENQPFTFIVVPGNHENYAAFRSYPIVDFNGARAYQVRKNIFYIDNGEIFELGGKNFFCMGGGYSIDRYMRRKDYSYWEDELPTDQDYKNATENIKKHRGEGKKIDYIISHTAPLNGLAYLGKNHGREEWPLNNYLQYVHELLGDELTMHYYGHLHLEKSLHSIKQEVLWFKYVEVELETKGEIKMHKMSLYASPFEAIKSGEKKIELRLYDEKRRKVNIGDTIEFTNLMTGETLCVECIALHKAKSFMELFENLPVEAKMGFRGDETFEEKAKGMREYYSEEQEEKYGVLGIELELI